MTIGERLYELRVAMKLGQRDLARRADFNDHGYISQVETGSIKSVGSQNIERIARGMGISPAALMDDEMFVREYRKIKVESLGRDVAGLLFGHSFNLADELVPAGAMAS